MGAGGPLARPDGEIARLDALVRKVAPDLLVLPGVGTETAAALLEAAG